MAQSSPRESREYPSRPFTGAGVVVFKDDTVLLIRRGKPPKAGEWSLPGGAQQVGETIAETAAREVLEETGVEIVEPQFLGVVDAIVPDETGKIRFHYTLIDFWSEWRSGEPDAADDAAHAEWMPLSHVSQLPMWEKTREFISKADELRCGGG